MEGAPKLYFCEAPYAEKGENRRKRLGTDEPKRFKYKKLME